MQWIRAGALAAPAYATAAFAAPHHGDLQEITVTATPLAERVASTAQSVSLLAGEALVLQRASTLGETVSGEPGVHSTFFGPGASRPVIRGLGGDRVQVLVDGLAALDASGLSEDHAVAIDPALADRVEIIRGPASLLYGTGASGGVVNVATNRIHRFLPDGTEGLLELRGDTALGERAIAGRLDAGTGRLGIHLDAVLRDTDDFEIPGFAQSRPLREALETAGEEPDNHRGHVPDTWTRTRSGGAGMTWIADDWQLGVAYGRHGTEYGIPAGHAHEEEGETGAEAGGPFIDLLQDRVDLAYDQGLADSGRLRINAAANRYEHVEFEPDGAIGTRYRVDGRELRLALDHDLPWGFEGTAGLQWQTVTLLASGEEAFVPDSRTRTVGVFLFEQRDFGPWSLELGARLDRQDIRGADLDDYGGTALNASVGVIVPLDERVSLVAQLARIERHPSATELYADGPHAATGQFEIGDPGFGTEKGRQAEAGLRFSTGGAALDLRAFVADYQGYLFLAPTGVTQDELPVYAYRQEAARLVGFEAEASLNVGDTGWSLDLFADAVRGRLENDGNLPRIPPLRLGAALSYEKTAWQVSLSARHSLAQDRLARGELVTGAYTLVEAALTWRPLPDSSDVLLFLRGSNLLDEDARTHSSPLKDRVPLPGRSVAAGLRVGFGG